MGMNKFIFSGHNERSEPKRRVITDDKLGGICTKQKILENPSDTFHWRSNSHVSNCSSSLLVFPANHVKE
jgi:hypothetical protein